MGETMQGIKLKVSQLIMNLSHSFCGSLNLNSSETLLARILRWQITEYLTKIT